MADTTAVSVGVSGFLQKFKTPLIGLACAAVGVMAGRSTAPKRTAARAPVRRQLAGVSTRRRKAKKKKSPKRTRARKSVARAYQLKP
jgi:hypothetical protein